MRKVLIVFIAVMLVMLYLMFHMTQAMALKVQELQESLDRIRLDQGDLQEQIDELVKLKEWEERNAIQDLRDLLSAAEVGEFEVTAYTLECGNDDGFTATMTKPEAGRTIAVDPSVIPLGSRMWVEGLGWHMAEDTGGAVCGNIIDRYVGSGLAARTEAFRWGRQKLKVVVLP